MTASRCPSGTFRTRRYRRFAPNRKKPIGRAGGESWAGDQPLAPARPGSPFKETEAILPPMRYVLAVTSAIVLFALGFVLAACGSGAPASAETTFTPGPRPSILYPHPIPPDLRPAATEVT